MTDTVTGENHQRRSDGDSNTGAAAPMNAAELATMFCTVGPDVPNSSVWSTSYAGARRILATISHLERLVYVPGQWRCAKCKFGLYRRTIDMAAGRIGISEDDRNRPELCPNGCGPLWRVSEREVGNELCDRIADLQKRVSLPGTTPVCTRCRESALFPGRRNLASGDVVDCPEIACPTRSQAGTAEAPEGAPTELEMRCYQAALDPAWNATDRTPGFVVMVKGVNVAAVARAVIRTVGEPAAVKPENQSPPTAVRPLLDVVMEAQVQAIRAAMAAHQNNMVQAARALDMNRTTLIAMMYRLGLREKPPAPVKKIRLRRPV